MTKGRGRRKRPAAVCGSRAEVPREALDLLAGGGKPEDIRVDMRKRVAMLWIESIARPHLHRSYLHEIAYEVIRQCVADIWTPLTRYGTDRAARTPDIELGLCGDGWGAESILAGYLDPWLDVLNVEREAFDRMLKRLGLL